MIFILAVVVKSSLASQSQLGDRSAAASLLKKPARKAGSALRTKIPEKSILSTISLMH